MSGKTRTIPKAKKASKKVNKNPAVRSGHKGFIKGKSGNPAGRPPGSRNKMTHLAEAMLEGRGERVMRTIIEAAENGEPWAAIWVGNRLLPVRRSRPFVFDLPPIESVKDLPAAHDAVLAAVTRGEIDLDIAERISGLLEAKRNAIETVELAEDVEAFKTYLKVK